MAKLSELKFGRNNTHDLNEDTLLKTLLGVSDSGKRKFKIIGDEIIKDENGKWVDNRVGQDKITNGGKNLYNKDMNLGMGLQKWQEASKDNKEIEIACSIQQGESSMCSSQFIQLLTTLLYRRGGSPWSYATFGDNENNLKTIMNVMDVLAHNTLKGWDTEIVRLAATEVPAAAEIHAKSTLERRGDHPTERQITQELEEWERDGGHDRSEPRTADGRSGRSGGGKFTLYGGNLPDSIYKTWMKTKGPNVFLLLNALYNLNIMGFRTGGLFQVEAPSEYFAEFNNRMGTPSNFDIEKYKYFKEWVEKIIDIVNSNREIFDSGSIVDKSKLTGLGPYKNYMDTSQKIYNVQWVGQGSPFEMWAQRGLNTIRYIFDNYGSSTYTPMSVVLPGGGNNDRIGNITFKEIVTSVKGTDASSEFIGGFISRNTNNYEGALLISKLRSYYQNIKTALAAQNKKLDDESDSFMESLLNDITIMVNTIEEQLKNITTWISSQQDLKVVPGSPQEVSLQKMLQEYSKTMRDMRSRMNEWGDNTSRIEILINGKKV